MRAVVDLAQALRIHVAVHLRRRERAVAEQFLDRAEVGAALEQVRREGVAEAGRGRQWAAQRAGVEPAAAGREEERVLRAADELWPRLAQVDRDSVRRLFAEWNDALLAALAAHVDELLLEVDVGEVQVDRLLRAQAGRVDELDQGPVAEAQGAGPIESVERGVDVLGAGRVGKAPRPPRRERRVRDPLRPERVAQERANGRELSPDRRRRELPGPRAPELGGVVGEGAYVDLVEARPSALEPGAELRYVDAVGAPRRLRERGALEEPLQLCLHAAHFAAKAANPQETAATISSERLGKPRKNSARSALKRSTRARYSSSRPCSAYNRRGCRTSRSSIPGTAEATK